MTRLLTRLWKDINYGRSLIDEENVIAVETYMHNYNIYCTYMWLSDNVCI